MRGKAYLCALEARRMKLTKDKLESARYDILVNRDPDSLIGKKVRTKILEQIRHPVREQVEIPVCAEIWGEIWRRFPYL